MTFPPQTTNTVIAIGPYRHARPSRFATLLHRHPEPEPVDLPFVESQEIAASIPAQPMASVVDPGKGLSPDPSSDWEEWIAPVLELCRPRGKQCRCGNAGVLRLGDERYCPGCQPRGLAVVDPEGAA